MNHAGTITLPNSRLVFLLCFAMLGCGPNVTGGDDNHDGGGQGEGGINPDGTTECPSPRVVCNGVCCEENERCRDGVCCAQENLCGNFCCDEDELCKGGHCYLDCFDGVLCLDGEGEQICCQGDDICFMHECTTPGDHCISDGDCPLDSYCEETVGRCLPIPTSECNYYPPEGEFTPVVKWSWPPPEGPSVRPNHLDVLAPPVIGDMDGDGVPEVAFVSYRDSCAGGPSDYRNTGLLTIIRGDTGAEVLRLDDTSRRVHANTAPALGDLDLSGYPEVVVMSTGSNFYAYKVDGTLLWESDTFSSNIRSGGVGIADLDQDGVPEVVFGRVVFDNTGALICEGTGGTGGDGNRGISTMADVTNDGNLEIIAGNTVYTHDCNILWENESVPDGFPSVADVFDGDGNPGKDSIPEVVLIAMGDVYVLNGQNGEILWGPHPIPGGGRGGAPNLADFDGDTLVEIGTAGGSNMVVFDPDGPEPVLWQMETKDQSSHRTGSTVFDFEGDGQAEVVYSDECFVRIYKGADGTVLFEEPNNTRTQFEYPLVVDIDGNGRSELVITSNRCVFNCDSLPGWSGPPRAGITVFADEQNNWVRTRKIWNQHAYHVTNINEDGTVPSPQAKNWLIPGLNNFRQNVQTWGVHNAPDATAEMFGGHCSGASIVLGMMVVNEGSKGIDPQMPIGFYRILDDDSRVLIGEAYTQEVLLPGMVEYVELIWTIPTDEEPTPTSFTFLAHVDDPTLGQVAVNECDEENNEIGPMEVVCDSVN